MKAVWKLAKLTVATGFILGAQLGFAQTTASSMKTTAQQKAVEPKALSMALDLSRSRSLVDQKDASIAESNDVKMDLKYSFSNANALNLILGYGQDLRNSEDSSPTDVRLNYTHSIKPARGYSDYNLLLSQLIPASKDSKERQDLQYGLTLGAQALSKPETVLYGKLNLMGQLGLTRYFHKYDMAYDETQNNQYAVLERVRAIFLLTDSISFTLDVIHRNTWTYRGTTGEVYEHTEELGMDVSKNLSVSIGHTLKAPDYRMNGASNVALTSEDNSNVYLGMTLLF